MKTSSLVGLVCLAAALPALGCGAAAAKAPATPEGGRGSESVVATAHEESAGGAYVGRGPSDQALRPHGAPVAPPPATPPTDATSPAPGAGPGGAPSTELEPARDPSGIIYTARVTMAVYQVDQGLASVEQLAREQGGYLSLKRDREITIRVPRQKFQPALAAIDRFGDVLHRDVRAEDVTDELVDLDARIRNSRAMLKRLQALLEKAAVKEALEIEKELHRVTEELERFEGRLKVLRDKVAYSTITVVFEPRGVSIQQTRIRLPFPWLRELGLPNLLTLSEDKS